MTLPALALVDTLTGFEIGAVAALLLTAVVLVALVVGLERYVFGDSDADPVGLEDLERDQDVDDDAWR
jgi:hypothetical protein